MLSDIQALGTGGSRNFSQKRIFSAGVGRFAKMQYIDRKTITRFRVGVMTLGDEIFLPHLRKLSEKAAIALCDMA